MFNLRAGEVHFRVIHNRFIFPRLFNSKENIFLRRNVSEFSDFSTRYIFMMPFILLTIDGKLENMVAMLIFFLLFPFF